MNAVLGVPFGISSWRWREVDIMGAGTQSSTHHLAHLTPTAIPGSELELKNDDSLFLSMILCNVDPNGDCPACIYTPEDRDTHHSDTTESPAIGPAGSLRM